MKNVNIFVCPSGAKDCTGYAYNFELSWDKWSNLRSAPIVLSQINYPSELIFCQDAVIYLNWPGVGNATRNSAWRMDIWQWGADRHNGGGNVTFCDGHAKYFKKDSYLFTTVEPGCEWDQYGGYSPYYNPDEEWRG